MRTATRRKDSPILAMLLLRGVAGVAVVAMATPAFAADVTTIAGSGTGGYSGDGGPAIAARLSSPGGIAVAADGTIYFADIDNYRVRRIGTDGIITTIAGTGVYADDGDGGPATSAALSDVQFVALSPADDVLYLTDTTNNRIRQVDLGTGVISAFAGTGHFGYDGDGGPAVSASFVYPAGLAVAANGNVYIADPFNCVVRMVDVGTGLITTVAGVPGGCSPGGDGGDALSAQFQVPRSLAVDSAGNLFVGDTGPDTVRRIDAVTHIITTVAGGGSTTPGFGAATTMAIGDIWGLALDAGNNLHIAVDYQVFKVDLGTGMLSVFAGTGVSGFSGDGGPAPDATFQNILGVATRGSEILIADSGNDRIRAVTLSVPPADDLIIELATSQAVLDALNSVAGSLLMINVDGREYLVVPNATSVGLGITITDNDQLLVIDLNALASAGGEITIAGNLSLQSVDLGSLTTVGGSLTIANNPSLNAILISGVTSIGGDLTIVGAAATMIDVSALATVTGSLVISDNTAATTIDVSALAAVGGDIDLSGNTAATAIDVSALATGGGDIDLSGNTAATAIDVSALAAVGGDLDLSGNTSLPVVDVSAVATVGGDLIIADNGSAAVDVSAGVDVGGDLTIETTGTGTISVGGNVTGDLTLDTSGYTAITGATPGGDIDLTSENLEATMHLQIQAASFTTPVAFSITRVEPAALPPESGADAGGFPATIDPVAAYRFSFAVPAINRDATISFDIDLAQLDAATRSALLAALAAGTATMVTKGDAPDSVFQAFPLCTGGVAPTADGCVRVEAFDALGQPTGGTPARVRLSNVVGHFSTWAVAIVTRTTQPNQTEICATLGEHRLLDFQLFKFNSVKGENVTITLAPDPAGVFTPGRAALVLVGLGLFKGDASALPNTITATLPGTGPFYVTVSELLLRTGKFSGAYCLSLTSSKNAWQTFRK